MRRGESGQDAFERLDDHPAVNAGGAVRIGLGPAQRGFEGVELGDDQAAAETGQAWIVAVDGRVRAGEDQASLGLQLLQAGDVLRTGGQAFFQESATSVAMMA